MAWVTAQSSASGAQRNTVARRSFVLVALFIAAGAPALAAGPSTPSRIFRKELRAQDGTALKLYRYVPAGKGLRRPAVLLVPDLALDRSAFDLGGAGLARELRARGFDTFVLEPRNHGGSERVTRSTLDQIPVQDVRAALDAIAVARGGASPVDLVLHGHSGALVLGAIPRELHGRIRRVVALSPAVAPDPPTPPVRLFLEWGASVSGLSLSPDGANLFELLFTRNGLFEAGRQRQLLRAFEAQLDPMSREQWRDWLEQGDYRFSDGSLLSARLGEYDRATLLVLAMGDNLVHPDFASPLRELAPRARVTVRVLSKRELLREDASHLSVLLGRDARQDVHLPIARFLEAADPESPPPVLVDAPGTRDTETPAVAGESAP